jgi:hypothetical protein
MIKIKWRSIDKANLMKANKDEAASTEELYRPDPEKDAKST